MFEWWKLRRSEKQTATEIYGAIVSRARNPAFYRDCGVSDTPEGRYEAIVLIMSLVLERLGRLPGTPVKAPLELQRLVIETFVTDMDDSMREMGVGDLSVPKKVKRAAAGLMERLEQYRTALATADDALLRTALEANIPELASKPGSVDKIVASMRDEHRHLNDLDDVSLSRGEVTFSAR
jgi:cytochrome b pre-mRNA-processing protein 3